MKLRDIPGLEGRYAVSADGRIYSRVSRKYITPSTRPRYMKVAIPERGGSNRKRTFNVHQLVAAAWLPAKPSDEHELNHIDGDRHNNAPDNLEWVTHSENITHAWRIGLTVPWDGVREHAARIGRASNLKRRKLSPETVRSLRQRAADGEVQGALAKEHRVSPMCLSKIINRITYKDIA